MVGTEARGRLVKLAQDLGLSSLDLEAALGVHHDRTNNGGVAEVIDLALADGDDEAWLTDAIRQAAR